MGKKFDAHKKHFDKKELELRKEINYYKLHFEQCKENYGICNAELAMLKKNFDELKSKYDKLLEYSNLSEEDIKRALTKDKNISQLANTLNILHVLGYINI